MKQTQIQELIAEMQKSPLMFAPALALIEQMRMLEKEEESMCQFAVNWFKNCPIGGDVQSVGHCKKYFNETFNTKEE